jgi:hypothetical protein
MTEDCAVFYLNITVLIFRITSSHLALNKGFSEVENDSN